MAEKATGHFLYFAYGSNLHPERLRERTPSLRVIGQAVLPGHQLCFHKLGLDGSAKCDARKTDDPRHAVHGVLYGIEERHRAALDRAESLGTGYDARVVQLRAERGKVHAWSYHARETAIVPGLAPFDWYLGYVVAGARYHGLPRSYVDALMRVHSRPDPQEERVALNRAVLERLSTRFPAGIASAMAGAGLPD